MVIMGVQADSRLNSKPEENSIHHMWKSQFWMFLIYKLQSEEYILFEPTNNPMRSIVQQCHKVWQILHLPNHNPLLGVEGDINTCEHSFQEVLPVYLKIK